MAEYIEREALIAEIQKNINTYWNEGSGGYYLAEDALNYSVKTAPTADVVPKSEVVRMLDEIYKEADQTGTAGVFLYGIRVKVVELKKQINDLEGEPNG
jgi:hypothetical protein